MRSRTLTRALRSFHTDIEGVSALEFAIILPVMITLFIGGFELSQGIAAYRKMTTTTRTVADLVTQAPVTGLSEAEMTAILNASTQVMAPFPASDIKIVVTQFAAPLSPLLPATVSWSRSLNTKRLTSAETLPAGIVQPLAFIIRADVTYKYTPDFGESITGPIEMKNTLYMSPRQAASIILPRK